MIAVQICRDFLTVAVVLKIKTSIISCGIKQQMTNGITHKVTPVQPVSFNVL